LTGGARGGRANGVLRLGLLCLLIDSVSGCSAPKSGGTEAPSARCASCHLPEFQSTTHPPHPGVRPKTCGVCHGETAWHPVRSPFLHSFPLQGGHAKPACFACHTGVTPKFEGTTNECLACHQRDQAAANAKVAHHDTFPAQCETCHTINSWKPTLPHEQALTEPAADIEPASVPSAGAVGSTASPTKKTVPSNKPRPNPTATKPWTPDQVTGASRVKAH